VDRAEREGRMDVIRSMGINWDMFYSFKDLGNGKAEIKALDRYHKFNSNPPDNFKIVGDISMFCNSEKRSGVDLKKFKETGISEQHKHTHVLLDDKRFFEISE
jgi:hypothetical protein